MAAEDPVTMWLAQIKEGDRSAVRQLLEAYFHRLIGLARARLQPALAGYDEDVALSAFKSLCIGAEHGRFPRLDDRDDLWRLLATMTVRKAIDLQRRQRSADTTPLTNPSKLLAREPSPELAAELADEYRRLLDQLDEPELRDIALWKVEGLTNEEIADRLGCVVRSVERKLHRIRAIWEDEGVA